jgi:excisionase family DNA binding protein
MPLADFDLLTVSEIAQQLRCSRAHVCNLIAGRVRGCSAIPTVRLGRRQLVRKETFSQWLAGNEHANDNLQITPERSRKRA